MVETPDPHTELLRSLARIEDDFAGGSIEQANRLLHELGRRWWRDMGFLQTVADLQLTYGGNIHAAANLVRDAILAGILRSDMLEGLALYVVGHPLFERTARGAAPREGDGSLMPLARRLFLQEVAEYRGESPESTLDRYRCAGAEGERAWDRIAAVSADPPAEKIVEFHAGLESAIYRPNLDSGGTMEFAIRYACARAATQACGGASALGRAMDFGAGCGLVPALLKRLGAREVLHVDIDSPALAFARWRYGLLATDVRVVATRGEFPELGGALDAILSFETLEHIPDPVGAVRWFHRSLRPGGLLFLTYSFDLPEKSRLLAHRGKSTGFPETIAQAGFVPLPAMCGGLVRSWSRSG